MAEAIAQHLVALFVYPGALAVGAVGLLSAAAGRLWRRTPAWPPAGGWRAGPPPAGLGAGLLAALAATQLAIPFNPLPAGERNVLVAGIAVLGAVWLCDAAQPRGRLAPALALGVQTAWLVALLLPGIAAGTLSPGAIGALVLPAAIPLKVVSGLLGLVCLPVLLGLVGEPPHPDPPPPGGREWKGLDPVPPGGREWKGLDPVPPGGREWKGLLWLPVCGLAASIYLPPAAADGLGLLRFAAAAAASGLAASGLAWWLRRGGRRRTDAFHLRVALPLTGLLLTVAVPTIVIGGGIG